MVGLGTRRIWRGGLAAVLGVAGCGQPESALAPGGASVPRAGHGHRQVRGIAVILPPIIDGRLDEGIWQHTPAYSDFVVVGSRARPALRRTAFRIGYDAANLYIALMCPTDTSIGAPKVRHWQDDDEAIGEDESCRVLLWPEPNRPGVYFEFTINSRGVVCDARRHWGFPIGSAVWDGPTQAAATITRGAWQAELRVPLRRLGVPDRPWHINVVRHDALARERSSLAPAPTATPTAPSSDGDPRTLTSAPAATADLAGNPPSRAVLQWPVPARPFLTGPLPIRQLRLADMEGGSASTWRAQNAALAVSDQHVTDGRRSLDVSYHGGGGLIRLAPARSHFSGWQTLRFDAFVAGGKSVILGVRLRDVFGQSGTGWFLARPGANDIALPLDLLGAGLRLRNIKALELIGRGRARVWVDHVRLEEDGISYHELPHRPGRPSRSSLMVRIDRAVLTGSTSTPPVAVDVTVPLFSTQRVRRLTRRPAGLAERVMFGPDEFAGHDLRDPVRVTVYVRRGGEGYFAFRESHLAQPTELVTFGADDFPRPIKRTTPTAGTNP